MQRKADAVRPTRHSATVAVRRGASAHAAVHAACGPASAGRPRRPQQPRSELARPPGSLHLRRARRRSIGFIVGTDGLSVNAPRWWAWATSNGRCKTRPAGSCRQFAPGGWRPAAAGLRRPGSTGATAPASPPWATPSPRGARPAPAAPNCTGPAPRTSGCPDALPPLPQAAPAARGPAPGRSPAQIRDLVQSWLRRQARRCSRRAASTLPRSWACAARG